MLHKKCDAVVRDLEQRGDQWEARAEAAERRVAELERRLRNIARDGNEFGCGWCVDVARDALKGKENDG